MKSRTVVGLFLPCLVGGVALAWLVVRPCEPVAQAAEVLKIWPPIEIVGSAEPPTVNVESLPKVKATPRQGSAKPLGHPAEKCGWYFLQSRATSQTTRDDAPEVTGRVWTCR